MTETITLQATSPCDAQREWDCLEPSECASGVRCRWPLVRLPPTQPRDGWFAYDIALLNDRALFETPLFAAVFHPEFDGFLMTSLTATRAITDLRLVADEAIDRYLEPHFVRGPLAPGQTRAIDLELHPGRVPASGIRGALQVYDGTQLLGARLIVTLATEVWVTCEALGYEPGSEADLIVNDFLERRRSVIEILRRRRSTRRLVRTLRGADHTLLQRLRLR